MKPLSSRAFWKPSLRWATNSGFYSSIFWKILLARASATPDATFEDSTSFSSVFSWGSRGASVGSGHFFSVAMKWTRPDANFFSSSETTFHHLPPEVNLSFICLAFLMRNYLRTLFRSFCSGMVLFEPFMTRACSSLRSYCPLRIKLAPFTVFSCS